LRRGYKDFTFYHVFSLVVSFGFQETGFILSKKNDFEKLDGVLTPSFPRIEKERATALATVAIHLCLSLVLFSLSSLAFLLTLKKKRPEAYFAFGVRRYH